MTSKQFRRMALNFPDTEEKSHMDHPDFRVSGKIFATLGYPAIGVGMVKLTPEQQETFVRDEPDVFVPVKGGWGLKGATTVHLKNAKKATLRLALMAAWLNLAPKLLAEEFRSNNAGKK